MKEPIESNTDQEATTVSGRLKRLVRRINMGFNRWLMRIEYGNRCEHILSSNGCGKCSMTMEEAYHDIPMGVLAYAIRKAVRKEGIEAQFVSEDGRLRPGGIKASKAWGEANKERVADHLEEAYKWVMRGEHTLESLMKEWDRRVEKGELA